MRICSMELAGLDCHEAGLQLLERMYREQMGLPMPKVLRTERGKPYFAEGALHFSVSHTKKRVFCALSERPVGIDAEETDRRVDLRLAQKILSASELSQYEKAEDKNQIGRAHV